MRDEKEKQVPVSDLGLASLLVTLNFELIDLERANEKRINFLFVWTEGIEKVISDFLGDAQITVPVQRLFQNQRQLKNRLYAFK
ncbi:MAG TPA: DUF5659 domain-containing protein [Candidatus Paceibacterota bacterium]